MEGSRRQHSGWEEEEGSESEEGGQDVVVEGEGIVMMLKGE